MGQNWRLFVELAFVDYHNGLLMVGHDLHFHPDLLFLPCHLDPTSDSYDTNEKQKQSNINQKQGKLILSIIDVSKKGVMQ